MMNFKNFSSEKKVRVKRKNHYSPAFLTLQEGSWSNFFSGSLNRFVASIALSLSLMSLAFFCIWWTRDSNLPMLLLHLAIKSNTPRVLQLWREAPGLIHRLNSFRWSSRSSVYVREIKTTSIDCTAIYLYKCIIVFQYKKSPKSILKSKFWYWNLTNIVIIIRPMWKHLCKTYDILSRHNWKFNFDTNALVYFDNTIIQTKVFIDHKIGRTNHIYLGYKVTECLWCTSAWSRECSTLWYLFSMFFRPSTYCIYLSSCSATLRAISGTGKPRFSIILVSVRISDISRSKSTT